MQVRVVMSARREKVRPSGPTALLSALFCAVGATACAPQVADQSSVPDCAWNGEQSAATLDDVNFAAPDTATAYWLLRYPVQTGLTLTVRRFVDARDMSFSVYDSWWHSYSTDGVASGLADYQLQPDPVAPIRGGNRRAPVGHIP